MRPLGARKAAHVTERYRVMRVPNAQPVEAEEPPPVITLAIFRPSTNQSVSQLGFKLLWALGQYTLNGFDDDLGLRVNLNIDVIARQALAEHRTRKRFRDQVNAELDTVVV